jgi:hypothetical protein
VSGGLGPRARARRRRAQLDSRAAVKTLHRLAHSTEPIVAGPWTDGPGFELLYWIPLLNWLTVEAGVDPERITAISRGGAGPWYANVAGRYLDVGDVEELPQDAALLEPSILSRLFSPRWDWGGGPARLRAHTLHRPLPDDGFPSPVAERPYVALHAPFGEWFPDTDDNREFLERLTGHLEPRARVVPFSAEDGGFDVQTRIVREADLFLSTDMGLAHLGPYVGTPTVSLYSRAGFKVTHYDEMERAGRVLGERRVRLFRARHVGHLVAAAPPDPEPEPDTAPAAA